MLPGTSKATSHFLCPAPGALGVWVLLGECGQGQLQESLPCALCSEAAVPQQPYLPQAWSFREEVLGQMPAQPWAMGGFRVSLGLLPWLEHCVLPTQPDSKGYFQYSKV